MPSTPTVKSSGTQTATAGGTIDTLLSTTDAGVYVLTVDLNALADGEIVELRINRKVLTGGTVRTAYPASYTGVAPDDEKVAVSVPIASAFGAVFTLRQLNGTGRAFPWEVLAL